MKTNFNINLNTKMMLLILSASALIYIAAIGYISVKSRSMAFDDAKNIANSYAAEYAAKIEAILERDLTFVKSLAQGFSHYSQLPKEERQYRLKKIYEEVYRENPQFYAIWDSWELSKVDPSWTLPYGRIVNEVWKDNNTIRTNTTLKSLDGDPADYARIKRKEIDALEQPYYYSYTGKKEDEILMTSLITPMHHNGEYIGVVGVDISLKRFDKLIDEVQPFEESTSFIIAQNGCFVAHQKRSLTGDTISKIMPEYTKENRIIERVNKAKPFSFMQKSAYGDEAYVSYAPITVGNCDLPWALGIIVPKKVIMEEAIRNFMVSVFVGILGLLVLTVIIYFIAKNISTPIIHTTNVLKRMAKGDISAKNKLKIRTKDELGKMSVSVNKLIDGLNSTAEFASEIGKGNLEMKYELLGPRDVLGKALIEMQESLKNAQKAEQERKIKEDKENWATQGLAQFADILRRNNDNLELLAYNVIKNLVKYMKANQGGIFILNEEDDNNQFLELKATYAYDRKKMLEKTIEPGDGLIGTCFVEKESTYIENVPQDYVNITSGLGNANPHCLLLVPLVFNEKVYGVVEIASFNELEDYQIKFVEEVGESIASTISTVKINLKTARLLEQSQQQSEEMRAQEEEMRQNMEELQATQETLAEKEKEQKKEIDELNRVNKELRDKELQFQIEQDEIEKKNNELEAIKNDYQKIKFEINSYKELLNQEMGVIQYDINGKITKVNFRYCQILGFKKNELIGKKISMITPKHKMVEDVNTADFWDSMKTGISYSGKIKRIGRDKREILAEGFINTIFDKENQPVRVMEFFKYQVE